MSAHDESAQTPGIPKPLGMTLGTGPPPPSSSKILTQLYYSASFPYKAAPPPTLQPTLMDLSNPTSDPETQERVSA